MCSDCHAEIPFSFQTWQASNSILLLQMMMIQRIRWKGSEGSDLGSFSDGDIEASEEPEAAEQGLDVNNMCVVGGISSGGGPGALQTAAGTQHLALPMNLAQYPTS